MKNIIWDGGGTAPLNRLLCLHCSHYFIYTIYTADTADTALWYICLLILLFGQSARVIWLYELRKKTAKWSGQRGLGDIALTAITTRAPCGVLINCIYEPPKCEDSPGGIQNIPYL